MVVGYRYGEIPITGMTAYTSSDGGATFGPGRVAGTVPFNEALAGPGDSLSGVPNADQKGGAFQTSGWTA